MKLIDRILIGNIIPKEGKFETLIILSDIQKKVALTQDEVVKFEVKSLESGGLSWNDEGVKKDFKIEFTEAEKNELSKVLKKMSDEEKLTMEYLELYKLFV